MKVGGYDLHLYCDRNEVKHGEVEDRFGHRYDEFPHQFYGQTDAGTTRQARAKGWLVSETRILCPKCSGKRRAK